jgi:hypothetical protein
MLLKHLLCNKIDFPCMKQDGEPMVNAKIFRKPCCFNECATCKAFAGEDNCIFQCPAIFNDTVTFRWKEYGPKTYDNGNISKELICVSASLEGFKIKFTELYDKYVLPSLIFLLFVNPSCLTLTNSLLCIYTSGTKNTIFSTGG